MLNDPLAAALSKIMNAERIGKKEVVIKPASRIIKKTMEILNDYRYLGAFEEINDGRGRFLKVNILGNINRCGVIKPRFSVKHNHFEKWEKRYLPAQGFGILVVSTPLGIMTHEQAKDKKVGGRLLAYCF